MEKTTGQLIKQLLKDKNMSQKDLCEKIGITESAMSKYLSSEKAPRSEVLLKIANVLGVDVYFLLGQTNGSTDTYSTCKTALLARGGKKLSDDEKKELINLILTR